MCHRSAGGQNISILFFPPPAVEWFHQDGHAHQVLGRSRLHPFPRRGNRPLRRQHLLRRSPLRTRRHHPRRRHRPAQTRPVAACGIQAWLAQPHAAAFAHALGPHSGTAVFRADLRISLSSANSRLRRRAQKSRRRVDRPNGKHLFSSAVLAVAEQHRN